MRGDARIARAGLDRLVRPGSAADRVFAASLAIAARRRWLERLIFVGLRRERVQPLADIALLDRLLQARAHVRLGRGIV